MPLTKYSGANIKKMVKKDLISHIMDLYQFIDLFDNSDVIKNLKEEITELKRVADHAEKVLEDSPVEVSYD